LRGTHPKIVSYNASVLKTKIFSFCYEKRTSLLKRWRCMYVLVNFEVVGLGAVIVSIGDVCNSLSYDCVP
jgi:hypothetical protein